MNSLIRSGSPSDLEQICRIELEANPSPWTRAAFESELSREVSRIDVIEHDGTVLGFVVHWLVAGEGHILNIAVDADARGRGLARRLVAHVIEESRVADGSYLMLEVRESNAAARGLYDCFGFKLIARRERYYKDNQETALILGLALS